MQDYLAIILYYIGILVIKRKTCSLKKQVSLQDGSQLNFNRIFFNFFADILVSLYLYIE